MLAVSITLVALVLALAFASAVAPGAAAAWEPRALHEQAPVISVRPDPRPAPSACGGTTPPPVIALRALQTRLMVSALSCGTRAGYGAFVSRFSNQLAANADALGVRYRHRGGTAAIDSLVTRLANAAAAESNADRAGFCARTGETLARLQRTPAADLNRVAVDTWTGPGCGAF